MGLSKHKRDCSIEKHNFIWTQDANGTTGRHARSEGNSGTSTGLGSGTFRLWSMAAAEVLALSNLLVLAAMLGL